MIIKKISITLATELRAVKEPNLGMPIALGLIAALPTITESADESFYPIQIKQLLERLHGLSITEALTHTTRISSNLWLFDNILKVKISLFSNKNKEPLCDIGALFNLTSGENLGLGCKHFTYL